MVSALSNAILNMFIEALAGAVASLVEVIWNIMIMGSGWMVDYLTQPINEGYFATGFNTIQTIGQDILMPTATLIFTVLAMYELCIMLTSKNSLQDVDFTSIVLWALKVGVAGYVLVNYFDILHGIWNHFSAMTGEAATHLTGAFDKEAFAETLIESGISLGGLIAMIFLIVFVLIIILTLAVVMVVAVLGRIMEVLVLMAGAPIPMATFVSSATSNIGTNYLKNFMAIGIQGLLMVATYAIYMGIVVAVFQELITGDVFAADQAPIVALLISLGSLIIYAGVTTMMLFRTRDVAKTIMGAS